MNFTVYVNYVYIHNREKVAIIDQRCLSSDKLGTDFHKNMWVASTKVYLYENLTFYSHNHYDNKQLYAGSSPCSFHCIVCSPLVHRPLDKVHKAQGVYL